MRPLIAFIVAIALTCAPPGSGGEAAAAPVEDVRSAVTEPLAIRGGVLMLRLEARDGHDQWPVALQLQLASGMVIEGEVVWIHPIAPTYKRRWTDDPRGLGMRLVRPDDDSRTVNPLRGEGPHLVARLPEGEDGNMKLGRQTIKPRWIDRPMLRKSTLPEQETLLAPGTVGELDRSTHLPDPDSPFEYWRWKFVAHAMDVPAPPPAMVEPAVAMAAEYFADLWVLGVARLQQADAASADRLIRMLTRTCVDRGTVVAGWAADPRSLAELLNRLVDMERSNESIVREARVWLDSQSPIVIWPQSELGPAVRLSVMSMSDEPVLASLRWDGLSEGSTIVRLEPNVVTHVQVDRAPLPHAAVPGMAAPPEPRQQSLIISVEGKDMRLDFGPRQIEARPPGVLFGTLSAPITLAEAQMRMRREIPLERRTSAQLRRLSGRWEVFFECLRPAPGSGGPSVPQNAQANVTSIDQLRGLEAMTILLGGDSADDANDRIWLTIPENGWQQLVHGRNDGTLQVHRRSLDDRWICRVVLPDSWIPLPDRGPLQISLVRSHSDTDQLETSPGLSTPWHVETGAAFIDLSHWDDLTPAR